MARKKNSPDFLTPTQAAKVLGFDSGQLEAYRYGRMYLIERSVLESYAATAKRERPSKKLNARLREPRKQPIHSNVKLWSTLHGYLGVLSPRAPLSLQAFKQFTSGHRHNPTHDEIQTKAESNEQQNHCSRPI
jgi:hypothetical protein